MSKWFCFKKGGLDPAIKIAAFDAGFLVEKNNQGFYDDSKLVIDGILQADVSEETANLIFQDAVGALLDRVQDPLVKANILAVLSMISFSPDLPEASSLPKEHIKDLVESFAQGARAVK